MNARSLITLAALIAGTISLQAEEQQRVQPNDLPAPVQRALTQASKGEPVKTINRRVIDGKTVYDIELERANALNPRFRITEEGIVVAGSSLGTAASDAATLGAYDGVAIPPTLVDPGITINDLPAAVRETVKREAADRQIADIDRESWQGRTVYEIEFKESGLNSQIHVAEDGTIVRGETPRSAQPGSTLRALFLGTQLEDTPAPVQETIRRAGGDRPIRDIDAKTRQGQKIYQVDFGDARTGFRLHIDATGRIIHDTRNAASSSRRG